jgi:hypothetical protein
MLDVEPHSALGDKIGSSRGAQKRGVFVKLNFELSRVIFNNTTLCFVQMPPKKKQAGGPVEVAPSASTSKPPAQKNASTLTHRLELH